MYRKQISMFVQWYCRCLLPNGHIGHRLNHCKLSLWYHKAGAKQSISMPSIRISWTSLVLFMLPEFFFAIVTNSAGMIIVDVMFKIFFTFESFITASTGAQHLKSFSFFVSSLFVAAMGDIVREFLWAWDSLELSGVDGKEGGSLESGCVASAPFQRLLCNHNGYILVTRTHQLFLH